MKEITRIVTAQIAIIETMPDDDADIIVKAQDTAKSNIMAELKKIYDADDVVVKVQDFLRDIK